MEMAIALDSKMCSATTSHEEIGCELMPDAKTSPLPDNELSYSKTDKFGQLILNIIITIIVRNYSDSFCAHDRRQYPVLGEKWIPEGG